MNLIFVSSNPDKVREAREMLPGITITTEALLLPEIQASSREIVENKVRTAYNILRKPLFVEDVSLAFEALNGLPGPYIKAFLDKLSLIKLHALANNDGMGRAANSCIIGYIDRAGKITIFEGITQGKIMYPKGTSGFDFDPIFQPAGYDKTYAQMTPEEKNRISARSKAYQAFLKGLATIQKI